MEVDEFSNLEQLVLLVPGHAYLLDRNGIYRGCNDLLARNIGLANRQEIVGKTNKTLPNYHHHPSLIDSLDLNNQKVIDSGLPFELEEPVPIYNGHVRSFKSYKTPIFNRNKEVIGLLGLLFDISETKTQFAELELKQNQTELALDNILANLPGHVYWTDANNCFLGCNDEQAYDVGLNSRSEIVGMSVASFQTPKNAQQIIQNNKNVMQFGKPIEEEENFVDKEGKERIYLSKKVPLKDKNNKILGTLGISFDITEQKLAQLHERLAIEAEARAAKARAKAEEELKHSTLTFAGTMSHDLRTPLSAMIMGASAVNKWLPTLIETYKQAKAAGLKLKNIPARQLVGLENISSLVIQAGKQSNAYIDMTLKMVKGAAAGAELIKPEDLVPCSMEHGLRRVLSTYPYKEGQEAKVHIETDYDFKYLGNELFMTRIIENLIKNALEQIELKGQGEIYVQLAQEEDLNLLKIKDTAGGITQATVDQLFQGMQSSKDGGTGLGLPSAKQIMNSFGGDINCQIVEEDCIEFVLIFPQSTFT